MADVNINRRRLMKENMRPNKIKRSKNITAAIIPPPLMKNPPLFFLFHIAAIIFLSCHLRSLRSFIFNLIFYFPLRHLFLFWAINLCSFPFASAQNKWRYIFLLFLAAANNRKRKIMPLKILNIGAVFYFANKITAAINFLFPLAALFFLTAATLKIMAVTRICPRVPSSGLMSCVWLIFLPNKNKCANENRRQKYLAIY